LAYVYLGLVGGYATGQLVEPDGTLGPRLEGQTIAGPALIFGTGGPPIMAAADGQGGMTVGWTKTTTSGFGDVHIATAFLDPTPPALDVQVPGSATAGAAVTMSATASDAHGLGGAVAWDFGDGASAAGSSVSHAYGGGGTYTVHAKVDDRAGNETSLTRTVTVPPVMVPPVMASPAPSPGLGGAPPVTRYAAALKLVKATRSANTIKLSGTIDRRASGKLKLTFAVTQGRTTLRLAGAAKIAKGRFSTTLRLGRAIASVRKAGRLTIAYAGDADTKAATVRRSVKLPKAKQRRKPRT
jgi:hypothetical protein